MSQFCDSVALLVSVEGFVFVERFVKRQQVVQGSDYNWDKAQSVGVHHKRIQKGYQIADCVVLMQ